MLWLQQVTPAPPGVGTAEYAGLVGMLSVGIVVLWRALLKKDDQLTTLTKELVTHTDNLNQIPPALDRLRTDVMGKLDRLPKGSEN